jgi:hypothetical protein
MAVTYVIKFDVNPDLSVWEPLQGDRSQMPNQHQLTAVFRWVRGAPSRADSRRRSLSVNGRRPRGFACEGAGAPTGSHASENAVSNRRTNAEDH